jgi:hypothetical protein
MQSFRGGVRRREDEKKQTVLAAGREKVGINEEKEKVRELVGGVLFCSEGPRDDFAASSPGALECGRWAEMRAATPAEFCSVSSPSVRRLPLAESGKGDASLGARPRRRRELSIMSCANGPPHLHLDHCFLSTLLTGWSRCYSLPVSFSLSLSPTARTYAGSHITSVAQREPTLAFVRLVLPTTPHSIARHVVFKSPQAVA